MMHTDHPTSNPNNVFEDIQTVYGVRGLSDRPGYIPPSHASGTYHFPLQFFQAV